MYPSVTFGAHNVTITGTSQDDVVLEQVLNLPAPPALTVSARASVAGTIITVIIESNVDIDTLTFECRLDVAFVPCKCKFSTSNHYICCM